LFDSGQWDDMANDLGLQSHHGQRHSAECLSIGFGGIQTLLRSMLLSELQRG